MDKDVLKLWTKELKDFAKKPDYLHLRFPLRLDGTLGDMFSPEGLLCELHSKKFKKDWFPKEPSSPGKSRSYLLYFDSGQVAPKEVLEWAGISSGLMSVIRGQNQEPRGFDKVIKYVEALINGNADEIKVEIDESPDLKIVDDEKPKRKGKYAK